MTPTAWVRPQPARGARAPARGARLRRPSVCAGFLVDAEPLPWDESLTVVEYVREHGIAQFIAQYNRVKDIEGDSLLWGDEVEYAIFKLDEASGKVRLSLRGPEILKELQLQEETKSNPKTGQKCNWMPEWGNWMVEGTPFRPYSGYANDLLQVERNMRLRRARILAALNADEICPTVPCFPMMGVGTHTGALPHPSPPLPCPFPPDEGRRHLHWCAPGPRTSLHTRPSTPLRPPLSPTSSTPEPAHSPKPGHSDSIFVSDEIINPAPRFAALVANIKKRRGSKVDIRMPRFKDVATPPPTRPAGCAPPTTAEEAEGMDEVYMDAMAFGMGCCCLQVGVGSG